VTNDSNEVDAIKLIFSNNSPPATSIKGVVGHTMGAAGIFNCLVAIQACIDREIPPTFPLEYATIQGIDVVTKASRVIGNGLVLVICSGFGGNNCTAIFGKD
jgi:3-oxoacyl-[acyl-carrier-protein] synthase II